MTETRRAGWLDWMSLAMVLLFAGALVAAATGGVLDLVNGDAGDSWFLAVSLTVVAVALFIVAVVIEAVRGGDPAAGVARGGDGVGGRAED